MSLKGFHVVFVTASIVLCGGVGWWGIRAWRMGGGASRLALGVGFGLLAAALLVYLVRFLRKFRNVSSM